MIELLLALTLLALLTGFLAGGLKLVHRAFAKDQAARASSELDDALEVIADQIEAAFPAKAPQSNELDFEGRPHGLTFAKLDQGRVNRGGLQRTNIEQSGSVLTIGLTELPGAKSNGSRTKGPINLVDGVATVEFKYFGTRDQSDTARAWYPNWPRSNHLPDLVSIQVRGKQGLPQERSVSRIISIRQQP